MSAILEGATRGAEAGQAYEQVMDYIYVIGMGALVVCVLAGWAWNKLRGKS